MNDTKISVVDFTPFLHGDESSKKHVSNEILESFKTTGFVYLVNHGLDMKMIRGMFDLTRKFFNLPMEAKMLAPHPDKGDHHRGYSPPGREKVIQYSDSDPSQSKINSSDFKESFEIGREDDVHMPNIWLPEDVLPGFREKCTNFYWSCDEMKKKVLNALAIALRLDETFFDNYHQDADNQLRLLHYPSIPSSTLSDQTRINAHTDFCSITLLVQDDVGGLEIECPTQPGVFMPIKPVKDGLLVNAGDFLMMWSNDLIKSTMHRVRAPPPFLDEDPEGSRNEDGMIPDRYSIVYFCGSDYDKTVECLPGTWSDENPKKYEPINAMEYVMKRLAANY